MLVADMHLHSSHSRATARDISLQRLADTAKAKGIDVLGTGDFTHPLWLKELKQGLSEHADGIYDYDGTKFILQVEVSLIYSQDKKTRRIHNIIYAPDFETVGQINAWLRTKGRLDYDGRPIFGFSCPELVENLMNISKDIVIIPAHVWTPWYSLFGSMSGFDSVEECFGDQAKHIFALETGLSSDPAMNWRLSQLDDFALVSFSDAHSPGKLGRECIALDLQKPTYDSLFDAIRKKDREKFLFTIEVPPHFGKYHYDGHRNCNVSMHPKEALANKNLCPRCLKQLTIGVEHRVEQLADREEGFVPAGAVPFKKIIPLDELIAAAMKTEAYSRKVRDIYDSLIRQHGPEMKVLLETTHDELARINEGIADAIMRNRAGEINVVAGYDGVYGKPVIDEGEVRSVSFQRTQKGLGEFLKNN
ncbi:MAG: DNA helicase UvrD [Candidatus Aenigmarchaeota archaeon]|nr:DNA helicase UvrD [Candidatus Aenigmarchaeota archaeon]